MFIKNLSPEDLPAVSKVHMKSFPDSIFTQLGKSVVEKHYEWLLLGPHDALCLGVFENNNLLGYCIGGVFNGAFSGSINKNKFLILKKFLLKPGFIFNIFYLKKMCRIIKNMYFSPKEMPLKQKELTEYIYKSFAILSIATDINCRKKGLGKFLMKRSEEEAKNKGYKKMHLSVHPENSGAISFYKKLGWTIIYKDKSNKMVMSKNISKY